MALSSNTSSSTLGWKISYDFTLGLFPKQTDVLPQDLTMTRSHEIRVSFFQIASKFDRHLDSTAAEMPAKCQSDMIITTLNLATSRLSDIYQ